METFIYHVILLLQSIKHLQLDSIYRHMYRANQLSTALRKEASAGLRSKSRCRRFSLGLLCLEHDTNIFGFRNRKKVYSYIHDTIAALDQLLGDKWDIQVIEGNLCQFVTQMAIWETKDGYVSGCIRTALCQEPLIPGQNYRDQLKEHLTEPEEDFDDNDLPEGMLDNEMEAV